MYINYYYFIYTCIYISLIRNHSDPPGCMISIVGTAVSIVGDPARKLGYHIQKYCTEY